jgi:cobalt transporter subunit CbtA
VLTRLLAVGLIAGLISGFAVSVVQVFTTTPIILQAEAYENAGQEHTAQAASDHVLVLAHATEPTHEDEGWAPENGLERTLYTVLANLIAGVGFAMLLVAAISLRGSAIDARRGVAWGAAGFVVFTLAPALGLPPEVPGSMAAALGDRQVWWLATAAATAAGLGLLVFGRGLPWLVLGIVLMILPHAVGAPRPDHPGSAVPPELAGHFVAASFVTSAIFWVILGISCGWLMNRYARQADAATT